jgi:hypothetical protein
MRAPRMPRTHSKCIFHPAPPQAAKTMAMTKRLWSISGLAVELNKDRRTIAKALADVAPDGFLQGKPAWRLEKALEVVRIERGRAEDEKHPLFSLMASRLDDWERIDYGDKTGDLSITNAAKLMNESPEMMLRWLRAGCPYRQAGNWRNGEGFVVRLSWVIEWSALVIHAARNLNEQDFLKRLHLEN